MDPLEPPLKGVTFQPTGHWSGKPCAQVFLGYCNLRCPWCNAGQLVLEPHTLKTLVPTEFLFQLEALKQEHPQLENVCFTGGEPTMHRGLPGLMQEVNALGFSSCLETNGTQPHVLDHLVNTGIVKQIFIDIKAPLDDESYSKAAGVPLPASLIGESLEVVGKLGPWGLVGATVVPGFVGESEVLQMAEQLRSRGFSGLALRVFEPNGAMDHEMACVKPYTDKEMKQLQGAVREVFFQASSVDAG